MRGSRSQGAAFPQQPAATRTRATQARSVGEQGTGGTSSDTLTLGRPRRGRETKSRGDAKLVCVLWRGHAVTAEEFRGRLLEKAVPRLLECERGPITVNVADVEATFGLPKHHRHGVLAAVVSVSQAGGDSGAAVETLLGAVCAKVSVYRVREDVARDRGRRTWAEAERTPGAKLVTLFSRAPGLEHGEFLRHWTEVHMPLALKIHPQWGFVRNIVLESRGEEAPPYDGIVEELCRDLRDITDPKRYFGSQANIKLVLDSARRFLDLTTVETHIMSEYVLRD